MASRAAALIPVGAPFNLKRRVGWVKESEESQKESE